MSKIGHAAKDERGRYSGGRAGDQTRREVYTRSWYNRPWTHILRADSPQMRERLAAAMEAACANDRIGYDQGQRNSLLARCRTVGYDPGAVVSNCECDCSSLVAVCCMYAGIPEPVLYRDGNCATTSTLRRRLMDTGEFDLYIGKRYLEQPDYLLRGDILLYEGHHVAICLEDGQCAAAPVKPTLRRGSRGDAVRELQRRLNELGSTLAVDGKYGPATQAAVFWFQRANGLEDDGICGPKTWAALGV